MHNQRVHNRSNTREYDSKNRQPEELLIQYLDPQTGTIHITPREDKLSPLYTPLRIMAAQQIKSGWLAQEVRQCEVAGALG